MRKIDKIILHCSANKVDPDPKKNVTTESIKKMHTVTNGWSDIGYHFVIEVDGSVHVGRPCNTAGAHCSGQNSYSIGICYVGGLDSNMKPKDTRNEAQKKAMWNLVNILMSVYGLSLSNVHCHNEYSNKACPSFSIDTFREEMRKYKK